MNNVKAREWLTVGALLVAMQILLIINPGYFSHDELQWGAFASVSRWQDLSWVSWADWQTFQFRPLTFNIWLLMSHFLFNFPELFHGVFVLLGSLNAVGIFALLRRLTVTPFVAGTAALVFAIGPFAAYVHGWVATLGDLLWVGLGILLAHIVLSSSHSNWRPRSTFVAALLITALALLAKEAALSITALLILGWWLSGRLNNVAWASAGSAVASVTYLAFRLPTLLWQPREGGSYGTSFVESPQRLLEYYLFIAQPNKFEAANALTGSLSVPALTAALWLFVLVSAMRSCKSAALILTLGGALALAPVLPLTFSANQYGYGFAAVLAVGGALAWPHLGRLPRIAAALLCCLTVLHGVNVQRQMLRIGTIQAVYQPEMASAVAESSGTLRLRLPERDDWIFRRLSHEIPSYRGIVIGSRVALVPFGEPADMQIKDDGQLTPVN